MPLPMLPEDFQRAIRRVLTSPFPNLSNSMLELSAWSINLGQASMEMMYLTLLFWVCHLQLVHECSAQSMVQMANPGMDPVHASKYHVADMLQQSHLLTAEDTPLHTPHLASCPIDYHVRAKGSLIGDNLVIDRSDPDHATVRATLHPVLPGHRQIQH